MYDLISLGKNARRASVSLRTSDTNTRNRALCAIADALREHTEEILEANRLDVASARASGVRNVMIDRLSLTAGRIHDIAAAAEEVARLADPIGVIDYGANRPNGLQILRTRVPIGVIGMIFEARPNVTVDAAVLCLKSANACILRGGKDAFASNRILVELMRRAVEQAGLPADSIGLVEDTSHDTAERLMRLNGYIDVLIPRGSARLIRSVVDNATVPVIETGAGNCHMYVDAAANLQMAVDIVDNGKTQRPSVCNALETVLVHKAVATEFLPMMKTRLDLHNVELRGCDRSRAILRSMERATEEDWSTEYDDFILAVKVVDSLDEAIAHICAYSTGHSDGIVTNDLAASRRFIAQIDSAAVYVNASTRFTDGGEFGLGAEIGISTQKLHTRGPMGLDALTSIKYIVTGSGQIRP